MELSQDFYGTPLNSQEMRFNFTPGLSPTTVANKNANDMDVDVDEGGGGIDDDDDEKTIDLFFDDMTWIQHQQQQKQRDDDLDDFIPPQPQPQPLSVIQEDQEQEQTQEAVVAPAMTAADQAAADEASLARIFMQSVADAQAQEDVYPVSVKLPNGCIVSLGMVAAHRLPKVLQYINSTIYL